MKPIRLIVVMMLVGGPLFADERAIPALTDAVPASPGSELDRYEKYVYGIVASRWRSETEMAFGSIPGGHLIVGFTVHSNGTLADLSITDGARDLELASMCKWVLMTSAPFNPFSDKLRAEVGEYYNDAYIFTASERPALHGTFSTVRLPSAELSMKPLTGMPKVDLFDNSGVDLTTPLELYRRSVRDRIDPIWHRAIDENKTGLSYGKVSISFIVHCDGSVSDPTVKLGDASRLLKTVSMNVILDSAPYPPFPDAVVQEMGFSYVDEYTFEVTRPTSGMTEKEAEQRVAPPPPD